MGLPFFPQTRVFGGIIEGNSLLPTLPFNQPERTTAPRPGILNPDAARDARQQAILAAGLSLLSNTGPSLTPQSPLAALGQAGQVFQAVSQQEQARAEERQRIAEAERRREEARAAVLENLTGRQRTLAAAAFDVNPQAGVAMAVDLAARNEAEVQEADTTAAVNQILQSEGLDATTRELVARMEPGAQLTFARDYLGAQDEAERSQAVRRRINAGLASVGVDPAPLAGLTNAKAAELLTQHMGPRENVVNVVDGVVVTTDKATGERVGSFRVPGAGGVPNRTVDDAAKLFEQFQKTEAFKRADEVASVLRSAEAAYRAPQDTASDEALISAGPQVLFPGEAVTEGSLQSFRDAIQPDSRMRRVFNDVTGQRTALEPESRDRAIAQIRRTAAAQQAEADAEQARIWNTAIAQGYTPAVLMAAGFRPPGAVPAVTPTQIETGGALSGSVPVDVLRGGTSFQRRFTMPDAIPRIPR